MPPILHLQDLCKQFATAGERVIDRVSFSLAAGEILGLLGPSGCGKTTLLRVIAGFEQPQAGRVELAGETIADDRQAMPPENRDIGMVFQDYALFPHLTVLKNVAFGLAQTRRKRFNTLQINQLAREAIALVGLTDLEQRYPHELSGGQQQRVALARAIAPQPQIILLDEPLSNLDVQVRLRLRQEIRRILKVTNTAAIFVTHDQEEALAVCDRVGVMRQGRLEQVGTPEELYHQPQSRFVADFVTQANFLPAIRHGDYWVTEVGKFPAAQNSESDCEVMIRQEDIQIQPEEGSGMVVRDRQFLGREYAYCLALPSGQLLYVRSAQHPAVAEGSSVGVQVHPKAVRIFHGLA
jgi:iron(III) transport system ATP-binding protein